MPQNVDSAIEVIQLSKLVGFKFQQAGLSMKAKVLSRLEACVAAKAVGDDSLATFSTIELFHKSFFNAFDKELSAEYFISFYLLNAKAREDVPLGKINTICNDKQRANRIQLLRFIHEVELLIDNYGITVAVPKVDGDELSIFGSVVRNSSWVSLLAKFNLGKDFRDMATLCLPKYIGSNQGTQNYNYNLERLNLSVGEKIHPKKTVSSAFELTLKISDQFLLEHKLYRKLKAVKPKSPKALAGGRAKSKAMLSTSEAAAIDYVNRALEAAAKKLQEPVAVVGDAAEVSKGLISTFENELASIEKNYAAMLDKIDVEKKKQTEDAAVSALKALPDDIRDALIHNPALLKCLTI